MAALEKIRQRAVLLVIFVGGALLAFVLGDLLKSGSTFFHQSQENILSVNGTTVRVQEFQQKVEERTNMLKRSNPNRSFTDDENTQIRQSVLNEEIDNILFDEEIGTLGLVVNPDEFHDLVLGNNPSPVLQQIPDFQDPKTGRLNPEALRQFIQMIESDEYDEQYGAQITEMRNGWKQIEQQILKERLGRKFMSLMSTALLSNDIDAKMAFDDNKTSVDFDYVAQAYTALPDSAVSVSDSEIQKLYDERKNQFKREEAEVIDFIAVNILPDQSDFQAVEKRMIELRDKMAASDKVSDLLQGNSDVPYVDAYRSPAEMDENERMFIAKHQSAIEGPILTDRTYNVYKLEGETKAPDSVQVNVLAFPVVTTNAIAQKQLLDSLLQVVKKGTPFTQMAMSYTNGQTNGELGWATEAQLTTQVGVDFKNAVFSAPLNTPQIIETSRGVFLTQVTAKTAPVMKYKLANLQIHVGAGQETKTRLYNNLSQFISTNHSSALWNEKAAEAGYVVQNDVEVTKEQINFGNIRGSRTLIRWAFDSKNKKGAISDITECQNGEYFVVASREGKIAAGVRSLAAVSELLKRELINQKKGEKLVADLKAKNFQSLDQYAEAMNATPQSVKFLTFATPNITGIGSEPILNAELPQAQVNQIAGPFAGRTRAYVAFVTNKQESDKPFDAAEQRKQLDTQNMYYSYQLFQNPELLRENAKIVNNFNRFF